MKKLMKRVCLALMVALLGVVSLMKADSVDGASTTQFILDNTLNIQVVDDNGAEFKYAYVDITDLNGEAVTRVYMSDKSITNYWGSYKIYVAGEKLSASYTLFQKYIPNGTVRGVAETTKGYPLNSSVNIDSTAKKISICYTPNTADVALNPNTLGIYVDPKWKNTNGSIETTVDRPFSSYTGLMTQTLTAGCHRVGMMLGNGGSIEYIDTTSTRTEYYKTRIRLSDLDSRFTTEGVFVKDGQTINIASGNTSKCAMVYFYSGSFITVPVPDAQGYVEVYVDKSTGTFGYNVDYVYGASSGGGGGTTGGTNGCLMQDMYIQTAPAASLGVTIMNLPAGTYKLTCYPSLGGYQTPAEQTIVITNSGAANTSKFVVHKHKYDTWVSDGTYHWYECCGTINSKAKHSYGSWVIDKAATEDATGSKHRNCTVCKYKQTETIAKLAHTHKDTASWSMDASNHWKICPCGIAINTAAHTYGSWVTDKAATEDATGSKHRNCTVCNYKQTATIDKLPHTHKPASTWSKNSTNHWKVCPCGAKLNTAAHTYGSWVIDKEATEDIEGQKHRNCTVCNYKQTQTIDKLPHTHKHSTKWSSDATNHWYECQCGDKKSVAAHASKTEATETTAKTCDVCGYIISPATGHINHTADSSKYYNDESNHWYQCIGCTMKMDENPHDFQWIVDLEATEDYAGQKHEECSDCGFKKEAVEIPQIIVETEPDTEPDSVVEPNTEVPTNQPETESNTTAAEDDKAESNTEDNYHNMIFIILGIVLGIGALIAVIIILVKKKKKK